MIFTSDEIIEFLRSKITSTSSRKPEQIQMESHLQEDLGFDSVDLLEMVWGVEDKYKIKISDEAYESIKTIEDVVNYIQQQTQAHSA